jgi:hypothetical protein
MFQSVAGNLRAPNWTTESAVPVRRSDWITSEDVPIINHEWKAGRPGSDCCATTYISGCRSGLTKLRMKRAPELNLIARHFLMTSLAYDRGGN